MHDDYLAALRAYLQFVLDRHFERDEAELSAFADALTAWLYEFQTRLMPDWRESLGAVLAEQAAAGRWLTPESHEELLDYLEAWWELAKEQHNQDQAGRVGVHSSSHTESLVKKSSMGKSILAATSELAVPSKGPTGGAHGGVYLLRDVETGRVMRTGRTNDLVRRKGEHFQDPLLKDYKFEPVYRTDDYDEQRGLEQELDWQYDPPLNYLRPIGVYNQNLRRYLRGANDFLDDAHRGD